MDLLGRTRALARTSVLGEVPAPALVALAERVRVIELGAGARATTKRDGSDFVLIVAAGAVTADGGTRTAGELIGVGPALVGGSAIELEAGAAATLIEITVDDFLDVLVEHAVASAALARMLAAQIRGAPR
jgi:CRP-like cAMP-binding protein